MYYKGERNHVNQNLNEKWLGMDKNKEFAEVVQTIIDGGGAKGKFYADAPIPLLPSEQTLQSFKINSNTYKVGDVQTPAQSIFVNGAIISDLSGWANLSNVLTRDYNNFYEANDQSIGNNVVGTEFVMRETSSGRYWRIKFSSWTQGGNGGGFSYERTEIDPNTGQDLGATVTFTKDDNVPNTDVIIPGVLEITRGNQQGIYNSALEPNYDNNTNVSPLNTEWNSNFTVSINSYTIKCYWSYNNYGKDNFIEEYSTQDLVFNFIFSLGFSFNQDPGLGILNKIETPTTLRKVDGTSFIDSIIPNVERDIYLTVTCEGSSGSEIKVNYITQFKNVIDIFLFTNLIQ